MYASRFAFPSAVAHYSRAPYVELWMMSHRLIIARRLIGRSSPRTLASAYPAARHLRPAAVSSDVIALHVQHAGLLGAELQLLEESERDAEEEKDEDARREAGLDVLHENLVDCRG